MQESNMKADMAKLEESLREVISDYIFTSKYARYIPDKKRRETWDEAVDRVRDMHLRHYNMSPELERKTRWAFELMRQDKVYGSMRSLQFGGKAIEVNNLRQYNCAMTHITSVRSFAEVFYLLLCGCGVGYSLYPQFVEQVPELISAASLGAGREIDTYTHVIEDSIEGWADTIQVLLDAYTKGNALSGKFVIFDDSQVRPEGAPLVTSGGKAPGSSGLMASLNKIQMLLVKNIREGHRKIRPIDALDIICHTADAVLSGGVRRSATLAIFSPSDEEMLDAKAGDWFKSNPQRSRANITVGILRDKVGYSEFRSIFERTKQWGEPGFAFVENEDVVVNPCAEISAIPVTKDGRHGVQMCNLSTILVHNLSGPEEFLEAAEAASIIGTLQAGYTDFKYLDQASIDVTVEESLLGVSMTGMMDAPWSFEPEIQAAGAAKVRETNEWVAAEIGIPVAARPTAIKPEGTSSIKGKTMASGIHASQSRYMIRNIQANRSENVFNYFRENNPDLVEHSVWSNTGTDWVISFPIKVPDGAILKSDLDAITHLGMIKSTQENWVIAGTSPTNRKPIHHNVSCTVLVKEDEWDEVAEYLYDNRHYFTAVSLLPDDGDKRYPQAPMQSVTTDEEMEEWFAKANSVFAPDYRYMVEEDDNTKLTETAACQGGACEII